MTNPFLASLVIAQRMPLLWLESLGLAPAGRKESERMVTEKIDAVSQGVVAAQVEMIRTSIQVSTAFASGRSPAAAILRGTQRVARAAMAPGEKKIRSNIRRLSGKN